MTDSRDKLRALWLVMLLVVSPIAGAGAFSDVEPVAGNPSAHVTVDEDGGADYTSIGAALDNVSDGGTVLVRPASDGHYNEPVVVDKNVTLAGTGATNLSTAPVTLNVTAYNESASEAITGNPNRTVVDINYTDPADSSKDIVFEFTSPKTVVASNTTATVSGGTFTNRTVLTGYVNESTEVGLDFTVNQTGRNLTVTDRGDKIDNLVPGAGSGSPYANENFTYQDTVGHPILEFDSPDGAPISPTVKNLTLSNASTVINVSTPSKADLSGGGDWTLRNVSVYGTSYGANANIEADHTTGDWTVANVTFYDENENLRADYTTGDWTVANATVVEGRIDAFETTGNWTVHNSTFRPKTELFASEPDGNVTVRDSRFEGQLDLEKSVNATVTNLTVDGTQGVANIRIGGGVVTDTTLFGGRFSNIRVEIPGDGSSTGSLEVRNVTVRDVPGQFGNAIWGVGADGAFNVTVQDTTLTNVRRGVYSDDGKADWTLRNVTISDVEQGLEDFASSDWDVRNSVIRNTTDFAIKDRGEDSSTGDEGSVYTVDRVNFTNTTGAFNLRETSRGSVIDASRIVDSTFTDAADAQGVVVEARFFDSNQPDVDARGNWWGQAGGPTASACSGDVVCSDSLSYNPTADPDIDDDGGEAFTSVQNAVDSATDGDTLYAASGTYEESITLDANVTLVGKEGAVLSNGTGVSGNSGVNLSGSNSSSARVIGYEMTGFETGINGSAGGNWSVQRVTVRNGTTGVAADGTTGNWTVEETTVENVTTGVQANGSTGNWSVDGGSATDVETGVNASSTGGAWRVDGTNVTNATDEAVDATGASGAFHVGNATVTNATTGVETRTAAGDYRVDQVTVTNATTGVDAGDADSQWTVNGSTFDDTQTGVDAGDADSQWTVNGSTFNDTQTGVDAGGANDDWTVTDSSFQDTNVTSGSGSSASTGAVNASSTGGNWTVDSVTVRNLSTEGGSSAYGVDASDSTGNWTVAGSTVSNLSAETGTASAVVANGSTGDWTVAKSTLQDIQNSPVRADSAGGNWTVNDSTIADVGAGGTADRNGISAGESDGDWSVSNVTIDNVTDTGVLAPGTDGNWSITDSEINDTGASGINASSSATSSASSSDWTVRKTTIGNTTGPGIDADNTTGAWSMSFTTVNGTGTGVTANDTEDDWSLTDSRVTNTSGGGIVAIGTTGSWTVNNSVINSTGNPDGSFASVDGTKASPQGDATHNYWGNASGPDSGECIGTVDCGQPLSSPPSNVGDYTDTTPPVAPTLSDRTAYVNEQLTFDASGATDNVGVTSYEWDFDDSSTATGQVVTHAYSASTSYTVTLTVSDEAGNTNQSTATVNVQSDKTAPTADAGSNQTVTAGNSLTFDGTGSSDGGTGISTYKWDIGADGSYELSGSQPSHTFSSSGTYAVRLRVTDGAGNTATDTVTITVQTAGGGGGGDDDDDDDDTSSSTATPTQTDTPTSMSTPAQTDTPTSTSTSSSDGTASAPLDDQQRPSGETSEDEEFVDPSEISDIEIVDVRLETAPANSVNTTSIITLENPSTEDQTVDVRFVVNGEVVEQREVLIPAEERINATHSEVVEDPGMHEVAANLATEEDGKTVRTFDFNVGTVELDESGEEVSSSSAEPPSDSDQGDATDGQQSDDGGVTLALVLIGLVAVVAVILGALWRRRTD